MLLFQGDHPWATLNSPISTRSSCPPLPRARTKNLLPPPEGLGELSEQLRTSYNNLLRHKFAAEIETDVSERVWRSDEGKTYGLILTEKGKAAAGQQSVPAAKSPKKIDVVLDLLQREQGATLARNSSTRRDGCRTRPARR